MFGISESRRGAASLRAQWQATIDDHVSALAFSPDGALLAVADVNGPITLLRAADGAVAHTLRGHGFGTLALAWCPDGRGLLASAGQDGMIRLWDSASGAELAAMPGGAAWVERLAWSVPQRSAARTPRGCSAAPEAAASEPYTPLLASAAGRKLRVWDAQGQLVREYPDHANTISGLAWMPVWGRPAAGTSGASALPTGNFPILTSATYGNIAFWQPASDEALGRFSWKGSILTIAWSPDGSFIATGDQDATVHFWVAKTGQDLQMWGYPSKVRELAWDASSRYLATGGAHTVTVWDCAGKGPEGSRPLQLAAHEDMVSALDFQRRGGLLASGGEDGLVAVWHVGKGRRPLAQLGGGSAVAQLAWSPDDRWLAVGRADGTVALYAAPAER
ncbi:WD40 repeat domain-containing protein [Chloroflexia bacterium SDU3-3]|nr:WD40 repeat domain-containing protein [Chloroflexia bacterium SDU3-3]